VHRRTVIKALSTLPLVCAAVPLEGVAEAVSDGIPDGWKKDRLSYLVNPRREDGLAWVLSNITEHMQQRWPSAEWVQGPSLKVWFCDCSEHNPMDFSRPTVASFSAEKVLSDPTPLYALFSTVRETGMVLRFEFLAPVCETEAYEKWRTRGCGP